MPKGNIRKSRGRQGIFIKWQVGGVSAVGQQHVDPSVKWHLYMVDAVLPDLCGMIAETVDVGVAVAEIDMIHFLIHEEGHVRTPGKA